MKRVANSFDIFDTILARKVLRPSDIFSIIEEKFPFPNFRHYRSTAEGYSNGIFDTIYERIESMFGVSKEICDKLKEYEIETEIKNSYLITTNYNRIKDGDMLVSDMYLSHNTIIRILQAHGFNKIVYLFVTPGGKSSGQIWPMLKEHFDIKLHLGDNEHSDVNMARAAGINAEYTGIHAPTQVELLFIKAGTTDKRFNELAFLLREFRHKNPYDINTNEYQLYNDQAEFNIPLLILVSHELFKLLNNENRNTLLLLTRDGCLLKHIFKLIYPNIKCIELHSSRIINLNPNQEYKDYLKSIYNDKTCLIFDLFGAFNSGKALYKEVFGKYPRVHLLGYNYVFGERDKYSELTYSSFNECESFNLDCIGSLIKLENGVFIRAPILDYEISDAVIYKDTVLSFCNFIKQYEIPLSSNLLSDFFTILGKKRGHVRMIDYSNDEIKVLPQMYYLLTPIADVLGVTKGSYSECGHRYTEHYESLLSPWYNRPFSILEIGLRRYGYNNIPSLKMWKLYMGKQTNVYGFDSNLEFLKFNSPSDNIHIYIGNQDDIQDIEKCCVTKYNIIVDDSEHDSKSQQIMFKTLWKSLEPGGLYCFESLHWQPDMYCKDRKTVDLLLDWKSGNISSSEYITGDEGKCIYNEIDTITFLPSKSKKFDVSLLNHSFCVIKKKSG